MKNQAVFKEISKLPFILKLFKKFPEAQIFLVGGTVRDLLFGDKKLKDLDFVITKTEIPELIKFLDTLGSVSLVGKRFGVLKFYPKDKKFKDIEIAFALPRKEKSKSLKGNKQDFKIDSDPNISIEDDLSRRDFSINAIAYNLKTEEMVDLYEGQKHLKEKVIQSVREPELRFQEDYSRILRGLRFSAQLKFNTEKNTFEAMKKMAVNLKETNSIAREVVAEEFLKSFSKNAVWTLDVYNELNILNYIFPQLEKLKAQEFKVGRKKNNLFEYTKVGLEIAQGNYVQKKFGKSILLELSSLLLHLGVKDEKHLLGNYFGRTSKLAQDFCVDHRLSNVPEFSVNCKNLGHLLKSFEKIVQKEDDLDFVEMEELFFSRFYETNELLGLVYVYDKIFKKILDKDLALFEKVKKRFDLLPVKNNVLPKPLLNGHVLKEEFEIKDGEKIAKALRLVREGQLRGMLKTKTQVKKFILSLD